MEDKDPRVNVAHVVRKVIGPETARQDSRTNGEETTQSNATRVGKQVTYKGTAQRTKYGHQHRIMAYNEQRST